MMSSQDAISANSKGPTPFSAAELDALVSAAPCLWWRAFTELSVAAGLRVQEVLRLHATDVCERTLSVRITSVPVDGFGETEHVTLRRWLPHHHERVIEVPSSVMGTLARLRSERLNDSHVFVPDWKLDQLWIRIVSNSPVTADHMCPGIAPCFRMIQRRARLVLARTLQCPLAEVEWQQRPLASLRVTAAARLADRLGPSELASCLGYAGPASVASILSHIQTTRGAA
jgi:hypothetical protein